MIRQSKRNEVQDIVDCFRDIADDPDYDPGMMLADFVYDLRLCRSNYVNQYLSGRGLLDKKVYQYATREALHEYLDEIEEILGVPKVKHTGWFGEVEQIIEEGQNTCGYNPESVSKHTLDELIARIELIDLPSAAQEEMSAFKYDLLKDKKYLTSKAYGAEDVSKALDTLYPALMKHV